MIFLNNQQQTMHWTPPPPSKLRYPLDPFYPETFSWSPRNRITMSRYLPIGCNRTCFKTFRVYINSSELIPIAYRRSIDTIDSAKLFALSKPTGILVSYCVISFAFWNCYRNNCFIKANEWKQVNCFFLTLNFNLLQIVKFIHTN